MGVLHKAAEVKVLMATVPFSLQSHLLVEAVVVEIASELVKMVALVAVAVDHILSELAILHQQAQVRVIMVD